MSPPYTIGEIQSGIEITREQDEVKAAADRDEAWLEQVAETYNVLSVDARTFRVLVAADASSDR